MVKGRQKCAYCGGKADVVFECPYCKKQFCPEHKKPDAHECEYSVRVRTRKIREMMKEKVGKYTGPTLSAVGKKIVYSILIALIMITFVLISLSI